MGEKKLRIMMNKFSSRYVFFMAIIFEAFCSFSSNDIFRRVDHVSVRIIFMNQVKGNKIVLDDSTYTNPFVEKYTVTKLRYYISNLSLESPDKNFNEKNSYHLIDESKPASQKIELSIPAGNYSSLQFLLGVDSLHNVSGAQTDDLDPANDMFWTWNSGYVMAKMEGNSPTSKQVNNKIEFHIGGFSGPYNVLQEIRLNLPVNSKQFEAGKTYEIFIDADINTWWEYPHEMKIAEHANITSPGINAKNMSENYAKMFHIEKIISQ
jgi:hypothetical protein